MATKTPTILLSGMKVTDEVTEPSTWQEVYYSDVDAYEETFLPLLKESGEDEEVGIGESNDEGDGPSGGRIGTQDSAEPYARHRTVDVVPSRKAKFVGRPGRYEDTLIRSIEGETVSEKQIKRAEAARQSALEFPIVQIDAQSSQPLSRVRSQKCKHGMPEYEGVSTCAVCKNLPDSGRVLWVWVENPSVPSVGVGSTVRRQLPSKQFCKRKGACENSTAIFGTLCETCKREGRPMPVRAKHCRCSETCGVTASPITATAHVTRQRDGLHRTATFKLVPRLGRSFSVEENRSLLELQRNPEFLGYLGASHIRHYRIRTGPAVTFQQIWSLQKFSQDGRQHFSDDPAAGALPLDGELYVCHKPAGDEGRMRELRQDGKSNEEIAEAMGLAVQTVKNHLAGQKRFAQEKLSKPTVIYPTRHHRRGLPLFDWPEYEIGAYYTEGIQRSGEVKTCPDPDEADRIRYAEGSPFRPKADQVLGTMICFADPEASRVYDRDGSVRPSRDTGFRMAIKSGEVKA